MTNRNAACLQHAERVRGISSETHRITVEHQTSVREFNNWEDFAAFGGENELQTALVKLEDGSTFLNKDFVLDIATEPPDGEELPQAWLEAHPSLENHVAVMLTIPPNFMLKNSLVDDGGEIVFVADRSGSMSDKMESLKSAMMFFLRSIPQGRLFNLWCFGSHYDYLWPESLQNVRQRTLDEALTYVEQQFRADMGGTELLPVLKAVMGARDQTRMTDIIVLTDGQVWRLDETISYVQQMKNYTEGRVRVFALGIGDAVSHELVEGLAKAGGGYAEVISSASRGGWEDRLVAMLGAAVVGHISPLRIELDGEAEDAAELEQVVDGKMNLGLAFFY
jgi:von Willebrand factor type A domain